MSLINDALKRAAQRPVATPGTVELHPADQPRPNSFPLVTLFIALIPLLALGMWFVAKGLQLREQPKPKALEAVVARAPERAPTPVVIVVTNIQAAVAPASAAPALPGFKLQGIYWRPTKPSAVVNGKTVYIGDRVETARVTAIDQEGVTLFVNGESKVLLLP